MLILANTLADAFRRVWDGFVDRLPHLMVGLAVLAFFYLAARVLRAVISRSMRRVGASEHAVRVISRLISIGMMVVGVFVALGVMGINPGALVASLGLVSVGLGFALKDVIENFLAGITVILQRPFVIGDAVRFGDVEGMVEDVRVRDTIIRTYDGRKVFVPNRALFSGVVANNIAFGKRRFDFKVPLEYSAEAERAACLAEEVLRNLEGVLPDPPPMAILEELGESAVILRVYFWTDPVSHNPPQLKSRAISAVKRRLEEEGFRIPYPILTVIPAG